MKKNIIHIDFTPAEVDTYYPPTIEIAADIEYTIEAILDELENKIHRRKNKKIPIWKELDIERLFQISSKKIKKEVTWRIDRFSKDTHTR